jgi:hypothetical protein
MAKPAIGTAAITFSKLPQNSRRDQAEAITSRLQSGTGIPGPKLRRQLYHAGRRFSKITVLLMADTAIARQTIGLHRQFA